MWSALTLACVSTEPSDTATPDAPAALTAPTERAPAGLTYEVYVRSFQDSDGDGVGDLDGVRFRLPELATLGVRTLWLMPVFPAFGPAGYDVTDYGSITAEYGDAAALSALIEAAHGLGMRVLLDLPFNQLHRDHPWFQAAEAGDPDAASLFVYRDESADGDRWFPSANGGSYYARFGADLPDFDWTSPETAARLDPLFDLWLDAGADGYRLDAVIMLVEEDGVSEGSSSSHELVGEWVERARAAHPHSFFLAEASEWTLPASVSWLDQEGAPGADAVLDFPRHDAFLDAAETGEAWPLAWALQTEVNYRAEGMAGFLGSHDLDRLPSVVPDAQLRRTLRTIQLLAPGSPVLYYGEELDLPDASTGTGQDWAMRAPMAWSREEGAGFSAGWPWFPPDPSYAEGLNWADEADDPDSMLSLVRGLGCLRGALALDDGADWTLDDADSHVLAFTRTSAAGTVAVRANLSGGAVPAPRPPAGLVDLSTGKGTTRTELPAFGAVVYASEVGCRVAP